MSEVKKIIWFIAFVTVLVIILDRADKVSSIESSTFSNLDKFINTLRTPPAAASGKG